MLSLIIPINFGFSFPRNREGLSFFLTYDKLGLPPNLLTRYSTTNRSISSNQPIASAPIPNNLRPHTSPLDAPYYSTVLIMQFSTVINLKKKKKKSFVHFGGKMAKSKDGFYHNFLCWQTGVEQTTSLIPIPNPPIPSRTPGVLGDA